MPQGVFRAVDKYGAPRPYVGRDVTLIPYEPVKLIGDNSFAFGDVGAFYARTVIGRKGPIRLRAEHMTAYDFGKCNEPRRKILVF